MKFELPKSSEDDAIFETTIKTNFFWKTPSANDVPKQGKDHEEHFKLARTFSMIRKRKQ